MWRDASLVAGKDLRIEGRSRVATNQVAPFAVMVLVLFAFAIDPDRGVLSTAAPGLFWIAVLFSTLLAVQRSFFVGSGPRSLRNTTAGSGRIAPAASSVRRSSLRDPSPVAVAQKHDDVWAAVGFHPHEAKDCDDAAFAEIERLATQPRVGLAAAGTVYGALAAGLKVRETLLPLLTFPAVAPVLLSATRAWEVALGQSVDDGWRWVQLLAVFAIVYVALGIFAFGPLLEES